MEELKYTKCEIEFTTNVFTLKLNNFETQIMIFNFVFSLSLKEGFCLFLFFFCLLPVIIECHLQSTDNDRTILLTMNEYYPQQDHQHVVVVDPQLTSGEIDFLNLEQLQHLQSGNTEVEHL